MGDKGWWLLVLSGFPDGGWSDVSCGRTKEMWRPSFPQERGVSPFARTLLCLRSFCLIGMTSAFWGVSKSQVSGIVAWGGREGGGVASRRQQASRQVKWNVRCQTRGGPDAALGEGGEGFVLRPNPVA